MKLVVSYFFKQKDGNTGYGSCLLDTESSYTEITDWIKREMGFKQVTPLCIQKLSEEAYMQLSAMPEDGEEKQPCP